MSKPDQNGPDENGAIARAALAIADALRHASPGDLAAMRRMRSPMAAPLFWRLSARHGVIDRKPEDWIVIARILARLTPIGEAAHRPNLHDPSRRLGDVLCDGGVWDWNGDRPMLSEARLARLLAARGKARRGALERAMRMLPPGTAVNIPEIAFAILSPDSARIARDYYARLDRATRHETEKDVQNA